MNKDANFRVKFGLPEEEQVIDDFSCAIQKEVLLHGRLYVSAQYMCFYSKIFGHTTMEVMPFARTVAIEKRNTSLFIPNAIEITYRQGDGAPARRFFTSFKDRDEAITSLRNLWDKHRSGGGQPPLSPVMKRPQEPEPEPEPEPERAQFPTPRPADTCAAPGAEEPLVEDEIDMMLVADENQRKIEMTELVSFMLTECSSCADVFEEFFADSSDYTVHYREQRGDTATELTSWQPSTSLGHTRTVRFISPVKAAIGPKTTAAEETQQYQLSASGNSLLVQAEAIFPSVPYGECFKVVTQYTISRVRGAPVDSVKIVISSGLRWLKSTWWESLIKDGTRKENAESFKLWQRLATARWAERVERLRDIGDAAHVDAAPRGIVGTGLRTVSSMLIKSPRDSTGDDSAPHDAAETKTQQQSQHKAPLPFRPAASAAEGGSASSVPVASEPKLWGDKALSSSAADVTANGSADQDSGSVPALLHSQWLVVGLAGVILLLLFVVNSQMKQIDELTAALDASRAAAAAAGSAVDGNDGTAVDVDFERVVPCPASCAAGLGC